MSKPRTFQELATKVHDMEATISCGNSFYSTESRKGKVEFEKTVNFSTSTIKGAMSTFTSQSIQITKGQEEPVVQGGDKEVSHTKRAPGKEVSIR